MADHDSDTTGKRWVTVAEAATRLGIGERGVRWKIQHGQLRGRREGKRWMILLEDDIGPGKVAPEPEAVEHPALKGASGSQLLDVIREQQGMITALSGQCGYYQRRIQELEEDRERLLAPVVFDPCPAKVNGAGGSWWRRLLRRG